MSIYAWPQSPGWYPNRFEMRIIPNVLVFTSPYNKATQAVDLLGERWAISMDLPGSTDVALGAAFEAFFDRLKGPVNLITIGHQKRPQPLGTLRGTPTLYAAVAQLANIATVQTTAGATLQAGDQLSLAGQLVRVMAAATADGAGLITVEFAPRARVAMASGAAVVWNYPTADFRLAADGVPVSWGVGRIDGCSLSLIEST